MFYYTPLCSIKQAFSGEKRSKAAASTEEYEKIEPAEDNNHGGTANL